MCTCMLWDIPCQSTCMLLWIKHIDMRAGKRKYAIKTTQEYKTQLGCCCGWAHYMRGMIAQITRNCLFSRLNWGYNKEKIKTPYYYWPLWGKFTGGFPSQSARNAESYSTHAITSSCNYGIREGSVPKAEDQATKRSPHSPVSSMNYSLFV